MRFSGRLHTRENLQGPGLAVDLEVDPDYMTVSSGGSFIGRYSLTEIGVDSDADDRFGLSIAQDPMVFVPDDAGAFKSLGVPALGGCRGGSVALSKALIGVREGVEPAEVSGSKPGPGQPEVDLPSAPSVPMAFEEDWAGAAGVVGSSAAAPNGWAARVEEIRRQLDRARGATESAFDGSFGWGPRSDPEPDGPRTCAGVDQSGAPCSVVVVSATGFCSAHDPHGLDDLPPTRSPAGPEMSNGDHAIVPTGEMSDPRRADEAESRGVGPSPGWPEQEEPDDGEPEVAEPEDGEVDRAEPVTAGPFHGEQPEPDHPAFEQPGADPEGGGSLSRPPAGSSGGSAGLPLDSARPEEAGAQAADDEAADVEGADDEMAEVEGDDDEVAERERAEVEIVEDEVVEDEVVEDEVVDVEVAGVEVAEDEIAGVEGPEVEGADDEVAEVEVVEDEVGDIEEPEERPDNDLSEEAIENDPPATEETDRDEPGNPATGEDEPGIDWISLAKRLVGAVEELDDRRLMPDEAMAIAALAEAACRVVEMEQGRPGAARD